jgi:hypothetical protein
MITRRCRISIGGCARPHKRSICSPIVQGPAEPVQPPHLPPAKGKNHSVAAHRRLSRGFYRYKKAGAMLLDLHPAEAVQEGLFDKADSPRRVVLMRTIDRLNLRFGRDTMSFAAAGGRRPWKLRREFLSPRYTTAWDDLLRV